MNKIKAQIFNISCLFLLCIILIKVNYTEFFTTSVKKTKTTTKGKTTTTKTSSTSVSSSAKTSSTSSSAITTTTISPIVKEIDYTTSTIPPTAIQKIDQNTTPPTTIQEIGKNTTTTITPVGRCSQPFWCP